MAQNISGLFGYNNLYSSVNKLFAAYVNDIVDVDTNAGYSQNLTPNTNAEFATYIDYCFFANGVDPTRSFNGTAWSTLGVVNRAPIFKYLKTYNTRLYGAYSTVNGETYPSRVWNTGLPHNNLPRWELEWGDNLVQASASDQVTSNGAQFLSYGVKVADPFWILDGDNAGEYIVESVDAEQRITLTTNLPYTAVGSRYIVGSNYFDVKTDDNEAIRGLGENASRLMMFKLNSLHAYNGTSLYQIRGAPGTSSHRSIINISGYTLYFHGTETDKTGIYMFSESKFVKPSASIQPYIDGIDPAMFPYICAWREGNTYRCYVGDITNTQRNISVTKAVLSYDVPNNKWSIDPINKVPKCATTWVVNNIEQVFFGDDNATVYQTPIGYTLSGSHIPWAAETGVGYPEGSEFMNKFTRVQIIGRDCRGVRISYKLYNNPREVDTQWQPLNDLEYDKTELVLPVSHNRAAGINFRFEEISNQENAHFIEKISVFYIPQGTKFI